MKRKLMFFMTFLFLGIGLVTAQTSRVTGVVTAEEDGLPVVGASVLVNGTTLGTITDMMVSLQSRMYQVLLRLIDILKPLFFLLFYSILL